MIRVRLAFSGQGTHLTMCDMRSEVRHYHEPDVRLAC